MVLPYRGEGKVAEAQSVSKQAMQGYEEMLGADDTSTLDITDNLALLYSDQGKFEEAEKMYVSVLQGFKAKLGAEH